MPIFHLVYRTTTASNVPAAVDMPPGRLALNLTDERIFFRNTGGTVVEPVPRAHTHPISQVTNLQTTLDAKAATATTISAGVGMTGGGSLAANRTITMGTPSTVTGASTNSATGTTHTHALSITSADVPTPVNNLTGATLVLGTTAGTNVLSGNYNRVVNAAAVTITVNTGAASVAQEFHVRHAGTGTITFVAGSGVTINPPFGGNLETGGAGATVTLKCVANDTYDLFGQTGAA